MHVLRYPLCVTGSRKVWICGITGSSLLVVAVVLLSLSIVMFTNEKSHKVHMYTTADEDHTVYHSGKVWLMSSVCMVVDAIDSYNLGWVLFTGSCQANHPARQKNYTIQGHTDELKGYFFSFLEDSHVNISMNTTIGRVRYKWTSNERKAMSLSDDYCGQSSKEIEVSQLKTFHHTGYYYICIIPEQPTYYEINVTEFYHSRPFTNSECNQPAPYDHGSIKHKCCNFEFRDSFAHSNCVYLTTRNTQPDEKHMDKPHPVTVYMKYNSIVKTLTVVMTVALVLAASGLIIGAGLLYRARRVQQQQNN